MFVYDGIGVWRDGGSRERRTRTKSRTRRTRKRVSLSRTSARDARGAEAYAATHRSTPGRPPGRSARAHALASLNWPRTRTGFFGYRLLHLVLSSFNAGKNSSDSGAQVICSD